MTDLPFAVASFDRKGTERFQRLRDALGICGFGLNVIVFAPGERGSIHAHEQQEEVYLVLEGELTVTLDGAEQKLGPDELIRIAPQARRQISNDGNERLVLLAIGSAAPEHVGRDGRMWESWEDDEPIPPQPR